MLEQIRNLIIKDMNKNKAIFITLSHSEKDAGYWNSPLKKEMDSNYLQKFWFITKRISKRNVQKKFVWYGHA